MHTYIINYRSHSGSRFGLSLVGDSGWGPPFLSSSSMGEGKMQSVSFQDQPAVADDDEATERPTAVAEKEQPQVKLPWRQWRSGIGSSMGDTEDDTVTVGRKGSYREHDIIAFLQKHLEPWRPGRDWRILLCDDYSSHKSINVWNLCWSRGYIRLCHGGGTTPVVQPPDTDLNQHVRREYGKKEAHAAAAATHAAAVTDD